MNQVLRKCGGGEYAIIVIAMRVLEQQDEVAAKGVGSRPAGVRGRWGWRPRESSRIAPELAHMASLCKSVKDMSFHKPLY